VPSPLPFAYRNKADYVVAARRDDLETPFQIGFFARESHHAIDITHCPIQHENNNQILAATREALTLGLVAPVQPATAHQLLKSLVARTASNGDSLVVLETSAEPWPEAEAFAAFLRERVPSLVGVLQRVEYEGAHKKSPDLRVLSGRDWLEETVDGLSFRVTGDGFFQVNASLTPMLVQTALRLARLEPAFRVLDLYCGVGLFSLSMARTGAPVVGIEANPQAIRDARGNSERNGLSARFVEGDAARALRRPQFKPDFDVALLDPPRAGAADCVRELLRLKPRRIVYVSCDPATLARDIKTLSETYRLAEVVPLDLFPQTAHVETVARLEIMD
jgi:23S rRNA (uracil1939-C5)-methyltransferase